MWSSGLWKFSIVYFLRLLVAYITSIGTLACLSNTMKKGAHPVVDCMLVLHSMQTFCICWSQLNGWALVVVTSISSRLQLNVPLIHRIVDGMEMVCSCSKDLAYFLQEVQLKLHVSSLVGVQLLCYGKSANHWSVSAFTFTS